ncbi:MAG: hypothetical protein Unbinned3338contig1000_8 [Prokaryotic dsDNA virus sp.]|nr:MAG: hypothetical protein Unbinned3338contig1000_8 [Prokaryotic dsDNA virus sp.]|tara:strand:+ start:194 stop:667 length:474 start_codon:yes stop_codon:yes gene_type:complete
MPSLSLSSGVAKARDTKRTTLITDEPFYLAGGLGVWDDNVRDMNVSYLSSGTTYLTLQSTASDAYAAVEYTCIPYSTYKFTGVLTATVGGSGNGTVGFGVSAGNTAVDTTVATRNSSEETIEKTFTVGNQTTFWISFIIPNSSTIQYWDSIKVEETG